ncbi:hypothetical protein CJF31_00011542 [Rutstroemia sp. NJR-2017a BVV2]|nr:hypothetical protein CJF31_00011542 [Rutstroemia sp. NJR-2017a BVV2]
MQVDATPPLLNRSTRNSTVATHLLKCIISRPKHNMASQPEPEIVLYDLACTKNTCFSLVVWRIRLMLNYKKISYKTIFLEFPDIEPTLKGLLETKKHPELTLPSGLVPLESSAGKYTVPAIHHVPTNTYLIDSVPIAEFLESTYPEPSLPLTSEFGSQIQEQLLPVIGSSLQTSVLARELPILNPRSQEHFRRMYEPLVGHPLEDLIDKEEEAWAAVDKETRAVGELMLKNRADGPFVLGERPSMTDFFIVGLIQCVRVVDEGVFQRLTKYPGFGEIYEACSPFMEKKD